MNRHLMATSIICFIAVYNVSSQIWNPIFTTSKNINSAFPASNGYLYVATEDSGLYISTNGSTFTQGVLPGSDRKVRQVLEAKQGKILAATHLGLYASADNGTTWSNAGTGELSNSNVRGLAMNAATGALFAGTDGEYVYKSTDNGATWTQVKTTSGTRAIDFLGIHPTSGKIYAAMGTNSDTTGASGSALYSSDDNGATWTPIDLGLQPYVGYRLGVGPDGTVFVTYMGYQKVYGTTGYTGVFRSTDDGAHWTKLDSTALSLAYAFHGNTVYGCALGVHGSTDGGTTWTTTGASYSGVTGTVGVTALSADPQGRLFAVVRNYGLFTLDPGTPVKFTRSISTPHSTAPRLIISCRTGTGDASHYVNLLGGKATAMKGCLVKRNER
jgi:photosystem II stability/assembly factor-like uncharacterized protein